MARKVVGGGEILKKHGENVREGGESGLKKTLRMKRKNTLRPLIRGKKKTLHRRRRLGVAKNSEKGGK